MNQPIALIVDDELDIRELLEITLARMNIDTVEAENLAQARKALAAQKFHLCLADMRLPDGDGIELVREIHEQYPGTPVAMIRATWRPPSKCSRQEPSISYPSRWIFRYCENW